MDIIEKAAKVYNQEKSIKRTAFLLETSEQKTKKLLITAGVYESDMSKRIKSLHGKTKDEICSLLDISENVYNANTPYEKGVYNSDEPTENAIRIRKHRLTKSEN